MSLVRICALIVLIPGLLIAAETPLQLGEKGSPPAVVMRSADTRVASTAVTKLTTYFAAISGKAPPTTPQKINIVVGDSSVAKEYDVKLPDASCDESFSIAPVTRGEQTIIVVSGSTDKGMKQGIYHLLRNISLDGDQIILNYATTQQSPFIRLRVTHVGGAMHQAFDRDTGRRLPKTIPPTKEQLYWNHIDQWEPQRVGEYADLMDFFGYNGIEEPPVFYQPDPNEDVATARRKTLREHLDANGMIGVAKIDGTLMNDSGAVPYGADTKSQYDDYYRAMAERAGPYNEFVLTHWVDAGGWKSTPDHPCTIELLQDLHMQMDREFRRVNPNIRSILSLWNLQNTSYDRWKGYQPAGVETILNSGKIPPEVGIAMSKIYRADEAQKILAAMHPLAVWSWYMADNELIYTMHVHTHQLQDYFRQLPPDAGPELLMHVMDNCQRETNFCSVYVAGRLMWDPKQDADVYLREIARITYGPKLEEPVSKGLKAIADLRCGEKGCIGFWHPDADGSNGVRSFDEALKQATNAWEQLRDAQIDLGYVEPIKFHEPPATLLAELKDQVQAVATYMQFLKDKQQGRVPATAVPRAQGPFETYERLQYLQKR
jgi:hypothetical protein